MNRFLTRKKGDKSKGKGKKAVPEPEPVIPIATLLPSTDDFRTSLIMPSLSTRFSMLREQDDPDSKIGKASDDSVLQPKRQSRLHEFGFVPGGLSDIAEVSSLNGSIRPPFANERQNSFDSSDGSMMSRARPGEGNVLFGGRQKVYKINNASSTKNLGRALYEDDVSMSTFQKYRAAERARDLELGTHDDLHSEPASPTAKDTPYSPSSPGFSQRRETSSSTNSGVPHARTSTAATSIASQGANAVPAPSPALPSPIPPTSPTEITRTATKTRRLYDQGLDQHMHNQQSSALNRLDSIQRTRAPTGRSTPPLLFSQTRSATNLNDRFNRNAPFRTDGPAMLNGRDPQSAGSSPIVSRAQSPPPMSPIGSDTELNSAMQPNDRGKATALGAFNMPKQAFNEQQYAERMKRLQQERTVPTPKLEKPKKPSLRERAELEQRKRIETGATERSSSESTGEEREAPSPFSVFQSAANQMKKTAPTPISPPKQVEPVSQDTHSADSCNGATFFTSPGSSDDEEESPKPSIFRPTDLDRRPHNIPVASGPAPPLLDHPALRSRSASRVDLSEHPALRSRSNSRPAISHQNTSQTSSSSTLHPESASKAGEDPDVDSPTLGPDNGGLSGLIRQHLRNVSTVSSDYGEANQIAMSPPPLSTVSPLFLQTKTEAMQNRQPTSETDTPAHSSYTHSNPWDLDDLDNPYYGEGDSISSTSPVESHRPKAPAASALVAEWETDIRRTHKREPSLEEREAFQRELALRQRAIQESLRGTLGQDHGRNASPASSSGGLKVALNMLRAKSSRESFAVVEHHKHSDASNKAMRMLGLGGNSANASSTSLAGLHGSDGVRDTPLRQKPSRVLQQSEQDAQRELENRNQRPSTEENSHDARPKGRTPPSSSHGSTRDRSSSEASSGRSRSRPRQYRDDLEQAMAEGTGSRNTIYPVNTMPSIPAFSANQTPPMPAERPSLDKEGRMRSRSNSRTAASNYFESKHLQPIQTNSGALNATSPRLSPAGNSPMPIYSPGLPVSPRPSPGVPSPSMNAFRPKNSAAPSPFPPFSNSASNTPPVSGTSTPVAAAFNTNVGAGAIIPSAGTLRKKSINKADISDPIFLSTTSVIDTVNLPAGASLKNGNDAPPPVPPINPMRRRFGFGRSPTDDPAIHAPNPPFAEPTRTNSSEALPSQIPQSRNRLRKTSSEGKSLHGKSQAHAGVSPAVPAMPFGGRNGSPPRPIHDRSVGQSQHPMNGAMF
ncbi:hypothetical protein B0J11DRAFT_32715 [Dendryphion nanum]|uniref:Uncharacterized protein n=1 Tax=Dendryphion nanum TaxID=256645 RepID=A0A9P9EIT6_9PLEO|nr:hypothetical protein B0J11DRAFT_32715 [Dendryphion nanum]